MDNSILRQLYDGEIYPFENIGDDSPELQRINDMLADEKVKFMKSLSDSQLEDFQKIGDLQDESAVAYGYENFVYGYKLGVALLIEGLKGSESLILAHFKDGAGNGDTTG